MKIPKHIINDSAKVFSTTIQDIKKNGNNTEIVCKINFIKCF